MTPSEEYESRVTIRLPLIVRKRIDRKVKERRAETRKFSMNDWFVEAANEKLNDEQGKPPAPVATRELFPGPVPSVGFDPLRIPGVSKGMPTKAAGDDHGQPVRAGRQWLPEDLERLDEIGEQDPQESRRKLFEMAGGAFEVPKWWVGSSAAKRAGWLNANHPLEAA